MYKLAPFTYGLVDDNGNLINNYGEKEASISIISETEANDPVAWSDVFIDYQDIYESYTLFTNCIDNNNVAVFHGEIIEESTGVRSGHSMTVQGYASYRANTSGDTVNTLMVYDGWGINVRFLNYSFYSWTDMRGTIFNG